ncbi:ThiF family adenylyltransferase [Thermoactinospora rubra]|uniref:ThiF family adenylyltransferase n=1 Tax=Thermoactinospora rubra TaxID=1088767 RepID=UPI000A11106E|nr:ThiF family adenylyltransferase [Thermoactinospora rubra]
MRPRLKPALRRIPRDDTTLQFGVHPRRAVLVGDLSPSVRRWLAGLDGTKELRQAAREGCAAGLDEAGAYSLLDRLFGLGLLDDASVAPLALAHLPLGERDRLRPEAEAIAVSSAAVDGGGAAMARRRGAHVRVHGAGRVGAQVVALLAASGVGNVSVVDPGTAQAQDVVPGGLTWSEVGLSRQEGAVAVARRITSGGASEGGASEGGASEGGRSAAAGAFAAGSGMGGGSSAVWIGGAHLGDCSPRPDLVILTPPGPLDGLVVRELVDLGMPHLAASAFEGYGSVGPLVLPGRTACLLCLDLARRDRDPGWPIVTSRLGGFPAGEIACGTALATLVAAATVGHALAFLDGVETPVTNGTLDISPDGSWTRAPIKIHAQCRCFRNDPAGLTMVTSAASG